MNSESERKGFKKYKTGKYEKKKAMKNKLRQKKAKVVHIKGECKNGCFGRGEEE